MVANAEELFEEDYIRGRREISDDDNIHGEEEEEEEPRPRLTGDQLRQMFQLDATTAQKLAKIKP